MRARAQLRWAIVHTHHGVIDSRSISFNRRDLIAKKVAEFKGYAWWIAQHPGLSDAQHWRIIKRARGISVRRISMRVVS